MIGMPPPTLASKRDVDAVGLGRLHDLLAAAGHQRLVGGHDALAGAERGEHDVARDTGAADQLDDDVERRVVDEREGVGRARSPGEAELGEARLARGRRTRTSSMSTPARRAEVLAVPAQDLDDAASDGAQADEADANGAHVTAFRGIAAPPTRLAHCTRAERHLPTAAHAETATPARARRCGVLEVTRIVRATLTGGHARSDNADLGAATRRRTARLGGRPGTEQHAQATEGASMRQTRRFTLIATCAVAALTIGWASAAFAYTTKSAACSTCHGTSAAVTVEAVQTANDGVNATYRVTVSNPYGVAGWAVIADGVNIVRDRSATGTFRVAVGGTYTVWGVSNGAAGEGAASVQISPVAPPPRTACASGRAAQHRQRHPHLLPSRLHRQRRRLLQLLRSSRLHRLRHRLRQAPRLRRLRRLHPTRPRPFRSAPARSRSTSSATARTTATR